MGLKEIRAMDNGDFQAHLRLLLYFKEAEADSSKPKQKAPRANEILSGLKGQGGQKRFTLNRKIDPTTGQWIDVD